MSAYEFACHRLLEGIEPWGERRMDLLIARAAWLICSSMGAKVRFDVFYKKYFSMDRVVNTDDKDDRFFETFK